MNLTEIMGTGGMVLVTKAEYENLNRLIAMEVRLQELLAKYGSPGLMTAATLRHAMKEPGSR